MGAQQTEGRITAECRQHFKAINDTFGLLGGKWKVLIIANLASGRKRYLELQHCVEGIGTKMLSKELRELELNGLVSRTVMPTKPATVEYELTEYGRALRPLTDEIAAWGRQHREKVIKGFRKG